MSSSSTSTRVRSLAGPRGAGRSPAIGDERRRHDAWSRRLPLLPALIFTIVVTAIYVRRANSEFDALSDQIKQGR